MITSLAIFDFVQFGFTGVAFGFLIAMVLRVLKLSKEKGASNDIVIEKMRQEMLAEIEKREIRLIEITEKTIKALYKVASALEKNSEKITELKEIVRDEGTDDHDQHQD